MLGGLLQQLDLIAGLDGARRRNRRPAIDDLQARLLKRLQGGHVQIVDADALLFDLVLLQNLDHALGHAAGHEGNGALGPLPGDRRADAAFHPRQVDLGALQVGAGRLEQHGLAALRQHGVADIDIVFPIPLVGRGGVANIRAGKKDQGAQLVSRHLFAQALQAVLAQAIEIDAILPIGARLAVKTPGIPLMRLADETSVHFFSILKRIESL